jgi:hypothetical protein
VSRGALTPNPSLELILYGRRCTRGSRYMLHHREPGLQHLPERGASLERQGPQVARFLEWRATGPGWQTRMAEKLSRVEPT